MELDKRIIEGKKPLDCFDTEIAKQFIGKKGYFSDYLNEYTHICNTEEDVLQSLDEHHDEAFLATRNKWEFFLPAEWVKEPEKKYRPYTLAEWINQHEIGDVIHYRSKSEGIEAHIMYNGTYHHKTKGTIVLGVASFTLDCLFEDCEIEMNGEWLPFGVLDDNK